MGRLSIGELAVLGCLALVGWWVFVTWRRGARRSAETALRRALQAEADDEARREWLEGARQREATRLAALEPAVERREVVPTPVVHRERIIEREILVARCRYCAKLTPVDLSACRECGATQ